MVDWSRFIPADFEYDFDADKLLNHAVSFEEAVEILFRLSNSPKQALSGSVSTGRRTGAGRRLKIIFQLKKGGIVRIITGWEV